MIENTQLEAETNTHQRQLTPSQRAMVVVKARGFYDKRAKKRQGERTDKHPGKSTGKSIDARDEAGKAAGVAGSLVDRARKVRTKGGEAAGMVRKHQPNCQ